MFPLKHGIVQHEINITFAVVVPEQLPVKSKEAHIDFVSIPKNNLGAYALLPAALKDGVLEWLARRHPFFKGI